MGGEHLADCPDLSALFAAIQPLECAAVLPLTAERGKCIDKLLGLQALGYGAMKNKCALIGFAGRELISGAGTDEAQGVLEIVVVHREVGSEPVDQVGIPGRLIDVIQRLNQSPPQ